MSWKERGMYSMSCFWNQCIRSCKRNVASAHTPIKHHGLSFILQRTYSILEDSIHLRFMWDKRLLANWFFVSPQWSPFVWSSTCYKPVHSWAYPPNALHLYSSCNWWPLTWTKRNTNEVQKEYKQTKLNAQILIYICAHCAMGHCQKMKCLV